MTQESKHKNRAAPAASLAGMVWFAGWLFTIAYANLIWWKIILALVVWLASASCIIGTIVEVVLGKWLGCWLVYLVMLAPTALYLVAIAIFGNPDYGPIASGYIGLALLGALYVAIGLWASSLTRNQVIAAVIGIALLALLGWLAPIIGSVAPPPYRMIAQQLSIPAHADDFRSGVVDPIQIIYFVVFTAYMLFFTVKILESRRWR